MNIQMYQNIIFNWESDIVDYKWEIENVNLDLYDFDTMQKIFCKKIANVIIQSKKQNCAI